jgi:hypothetical protein
MSGNVQDLASFFLTQIYIKIMKKHLNWPQFRRLRRNRSNPAAEALSVPTIYHISQYLAVRCDADANLRIGGPDLHRHNQRFTKID